MYHSDHEAMTTRRQIGIASNLPRTQLHLDVIAPTRHYRDEAATPITAR